MHRPLYTNIRKCIYKTAFNLADQVHEGHLKYMYIYVTVLPVNGMAVITEIIN